MNYFYTYLFFILAICWSTIAFSQPSNNLKLKIYPLGKDPDFLKKDFSYQEDFVDSLSIINELKTLVLKLQNAAYLEASVDTLAVQNDQYLAYLHVGNQYKWAKLKNGNVENVFLEQVGFRERLYTNKPFSYQEVVKLQESLLEYAENNGYPFAQVWLDSIQINGRQLSASIHMEKGQLVLIKELSIEGTAEISKVYLENYLGLKPGSLYNRSKILRIRDRIRELPFVTTKENPTLSFEGDRVTINLYLNKKKASRFDFLIGVLPQSNSQDNRLIITGTFNGEFQNQFGLGERIYAEFEQLRPATQELNLEFSYPYVLEFPFGIDLKFDLFKRDTTNLNLEYDIGLQYLLEGGNYLKAFWNNRSTTLLFIDQDAILQSQRLPSNLDVSHATFGLEYSFQKLDYRFNPRKGWNLLLRGGAGTKRIRRNTQILELELGSLYDSLTLKSLQYRIDALIEGYLPIFNRSTIKAGLQGGFIVSSQGIYQNEQYRIGGNDILRGFDEESVFASRYAIGTLEFRFLLGQNSYFSLFGDYAYIDSATATDPVDKDPIDFPYGIGAGITFETKVGLFNFSLAVGSQQDTPPDFAAPKVHFGFVSLF